MFVLLIVVVEHFLEETLLLPNRAEHGRLARVRAHTARLGGMGRRRSIVVIFTAG